jgi:hypothetical protein
VIGVHINDLGGGAAYRSVQWQICYDAGALYDIDVERYVTAPTACNSSAVNTYRILLACAAGSDKLGYFGRVFNVHVSCLHGGVTHLRLFSAPGGTQVTKSGQLQPIAVQDAEVVCEGPTATPTVPAVGSSSSH